MAMEAAQAQLPRPSMSFYAPSSENRNGRMAFMLLGRARDKVVATEQTGRTRTAIYDAGSHAMRTAPSLNKPKSRLPVSVAVGDSPLRPRHGL